MEIAVISAVALLGYVVMGKSQAREPFGVPNMSDQVTPNGKPVRFNKVEYTDQVLPVEYVEQPEVSEQGLFLESRESAVERVMEGAPVGFGQGEMSLTGEPIDPATFSHNNMVPFFGARVTQNVDERATAHILDSKTGTDRNYQHKKEIAPVFAPHANVTNPYGMANINSQIQNRFIASTKRNNEAPMEPQRVGPGINRGYTAEPSGGFQQADARDYTLPLTVDELRTKNNPKISYQGRIITGSRSTTRGTIGKVEKRRPDSFYVNDPERYFTTTGAYHKPRQNGTIVMKEQHRKETGVKRRINPAGPGTQARASVRSKVRATSRENFETTGPRNLAAGGQWTVKGGQDISDYGRSGGRNVETKRSATTECSRTGNVQQGGRRATARNRDKARVTKKSNFVGNARATGNVQKGGQGGRVYDPTDIPRRTVKETMVDSKRSGNLTGPTASYVYDPNDIPRRTVKETTVEDVRSGNVTGPRASKVRGDDKAKVTARETTLTDYTGIAGAGSGREKSREAEKNMSINQTRNLQLRGHTPGGSGPNEIVGSSSINMTVSRTSEINSRSIEERGLNRGAPHNKAIPESWQMGQVRDKNALPNNLVSNRLDAGMLDALRNNPYAITNKGMA